MDREIYAILFSDIGFVLLLFKSISQSHTCISAKWIGNLCKAVVMDVDEWRALEVGWRNGWQLCICDQW